MASLYKQIQARLKDPKIVANFNNEVGKKPNITNEDERKYSLAHKSFQDYKKSNPEWSQHFE